MSCLLAAYMELQWFREPRVAFPDHVSCMNDYSIGLGNLALSGFYGFISSRGFIASICHPSSNKGACSALLLRPHASFHHVANHDVGRLFRFVRAGCLPGCVLRHDSITLLGAESGMDCTRAQGGLPQPSRPVGCPFAIRLHHILSH
jgi:hypothetical protein